ncbi:MAG TPA: GNAT family protein [Vicinamibacterales bacterium]|nr:GNAT family protein [Vicinamibacterales bacterium]
MGKETSALSTPEWRQQLPQLTAKLVTLREPTPADLRSLIDLLSLADASRYGLEEPVSELAVQHMLERIAYERSAGAAFTYVITITSTRALVGLVQTRQIDLSWESAEWECTLAPSWRGTGVFLETARLVGSFAFGTVGVHRLEARVLLQNGRANGALRKIGAVQEGILRESMRRGNDYLDQVLWSVLKEDWGEHWVSTAPRVH